jgi:ribonuclease P protein component
VGVLACATLKVNQPAQRNARKLFPKSRRLLRHADFEKVYKQGRRHFAAHMTVFYLHRQDTEDEKTPKGPRVGFTVGKVLGGAVQRNRMNRRLREAVRLAVQPNFAVDVVVNPKKSVLDAEFTVLQSELKRAFEVIQNSAGTRGK